MLLSSLAFGIAVLGPQAATAEPRMEERLLARIPAGLSLEGKPVRSPDGAMVGPDVHQVVWSPDGAQVGYVGLEGESPRPVLGEKVLGAYDYASGPVFGRDGTHAAFRVGRRVGKDRERWWVLLDGKEVGAEDWIGEIALAPAGDRYAAWTQPGAKLERDGSYRQGRQVLVTPWKAGAKWEDASSLDAPRFARDGGFVTALAARDGKWRLLLVDSKGEHELGLPQPLVTGYDVAPGGKSCALVVPDLRDADPNAPPPEPGMPGAKSVIVLGKQVLGRSLADAGMPRFAPDGKQLAWVFREGAKHGVALGETKRSTGRHDWIRCLVFRPDGKELAFAAGTGGAPNAALLAADGLAQVDGAQWRVVRSNAALAESPSAATYQRVVGLTWSRDGARLAFAAQTAEGWRIVCGEARSDPFDEVGPPNFAADGASIAFGARKGKELWWKVLALGK